MSLDPDCLARLKLRQAPFDTLTSEDFLYSDPLLESLVETAARAIGAPGAVVVLAGPDGSGRSIQLMRLLGALDGQYELIAFRSRPNIPFDAVDVTIRAHLRSGGFDNPNRSVADLLAERARAQARLVLAIDDAHLLGGEGLVKLVRLRATVLEAGGQGLRLILAGDPSLSRGRLPLPDLLDDSQVVRLNLRPFNLEQAGAYLRHRLRVAGLDDPDSLLSRGDIAVLQGSAKGLPAALNAQANAWLARRCKSLEGGLRTSPGGRSATASAAGAIPTPLAAEPRRPPEPLHEAEPDLLDERLEASEEFLDLEPDTYEPSVPSTPPPPRDPQLSDFLVGGEVPTALAQNEFEQILKRVRQHQPWETAAPEPKAASREEIKAAKPTTKTAYWNRPWFIPVVLAVVLLAIAAPVVRQIVMDAKPSTSLLEQSRPASQAVVDRSESTEPGAQQAVAPETASTPIRPESTPGVEAGSTAGLSEPNGRAPDSTEVPGDGQTSAESESQPEQEAAPDDWAEDLAWLMRQDPERFTIQLVAARDLETARGVLDPQALEGVRYVRTRSYVIAVLGSFPGRTQAARELPGLPASVRDNGPWIRTIGSIRDSLP